MSERLDDQRFTSDAYMAAMSALGELVLAIPDEQLRASVINQVNALHLVIREPLQVYMSQNPHTDDRVTRPEDMFYGPGSLG